MHSGYGLSGSRGALNSGNYRDSCRPDLAEATGFSPRAAPPPARQAGCRRGIDTRGAARGWGTGRVVGIRFSSQSPCEACRATAVNEQIPARLRRAVIRRARVRCEYCRLAQLGQAATFHIDHIVPRAAGGRTMLENLALACVTCSLRKGMRQRAIDPQTGEEVPLFHPRQQDWPEHFRWEGVSVVGVTAAGRATVEALGMNRDVMLRIRTEERLLGRNPPN